MAYIEICPEPAMVWSKNDSTVSGLLLPLVSEKFKILTMSTPEEVWPSLSKLFGRELATLTVGDE